MRDLSAQQTKRVFQDYYSSLLGVSSQDLLKDEFKKYVGSHTWHNSIRVLSKFGDFQPGNRVLDAGCGWGRLMLGILKEYCDLDITGVDLSNEALDIGRSILGDGLKKNRVSWAQGNLEHLPFGDEEFDMVYSARVFQHLNHPADGAQELIRVLKPGGRFVVFIQNKLCPLNVTYYSRLYSPAAVGKWFDQPGIDKLVITTMDFFPSRLSFGIALESRMNIESKLEQIPVLNKFGGKVLISGTKSLSENS